MNLHIVKYKIIIIYLACSILQLVTKNCSISEPLSKPELNSNHDPIIFSLDLTVNRLPQRTISDYSNANWTLFCEKLDELIVINPKVNNVDNLESKFNNFTGSLKEAGLIAVPNKTLTPTRLEYSDYILQFLFTMFNVIGHWLF